MDKVCEYCKVLRPVVYCKADSANLCLQCDAKIHSANALSNRHSRTLVCESCRCHWAYIRCSNHQMFMCRSCDRSQHNVSSQHQRRVISGYIGCPSSKDLAALWGFNLNALDDSTWQNQVGGSLIASKVDSATSDSGAECEVGRSGKHSKAFYEGKQQEGTCFILQQILNLKRIQSIDGSYSSSFISRQEQIDISSTENDSIRKLENNLDQHLQHPLGLVTDFQNMGSPNQDLDIDPFPSPFSHLDHLSSSSPGGSPLQEESIWQCKIPDQNGQLWSQNMQDLGVCEELGYLDEPSMPDIDLTFRNYEELFRGDEPEPKRTLLNDIANACDSVEKDISFDTSKYGYAREMQETALPEAKEIIRPSYKEKKKKVRRNDTQVQYATRKARDEWKKV